MCDCNDQVNELLKKENRTLNHAYIVGKTGLALTPAKFDFDERVLISTVKIDKKKRNRPPSVLFAKFCPFCGEKYT